MVTYTNISMASNKTDLQNEKTNLNNSILEGWMEDESVSGICSKDGAGIRCGLQAGMSGMGAAPDGLGHIAVSGQ